MHQDFRGTSSIAFSIKHENIISIERIPLQWISLIDLYNTALPQFPLKYVHLKQNGKRIFGFPATYSIEKEADGSSTWNFKFLSNIPLESPDVELVKTELKQRLGAEQPVTRTDIERSCPDSTRRAFLLQIWDEFIVPIYGGSLPFGRFYDGMYSLARCAAAFIPQSGGKSEWQMMYDFIRHYGEKVEINGPYGFLEFFLLPTYSELLNRDFKDFPTYRILQSAIDKFGSRYFNVTFNVEQINLCSIRSKITDLDGYSLLSPNGMRDLTGYLVSEGYLLIEEKKELDFLIDAFNRLATRALGFIGLTYNAKLANDFREWKGARFKQLYMTEEKRTCGIYPKIWGMILQQGFGNPEVIPIDEWIHSFYTIPLQMNSKEEFLQTFVGIGKLERMLWVTSQARKTNMYSIFDWIWCLKYGTGKTTVGITGSDVSRLREANPLSCLNCPLKDRCMAFLAICQNDVSVVPVEGSVPKEPEINPMTRSKFVVSTINKIPKYVFLRMDGYRELSGKFIGGYYILVDGFTGLEIHEAQTSFEGKSVTVQEFMEDLSKKHTSTLE